MRGRRLVAIGAAILIGSSLLRWWQVGGGPGQLPMRSDVGISDGPVFLMVLAAIACLLVATLPLAAGKPVWIDRPGVYLGLFVTAAAGYILRVADLAPWLAPSPPSPGIGVWLAAAGLAVTAAGVVELFRDRRAGAGDSAAGSGAAEPAADSAAEPVEAGADDAVGADEGGDYAIGSDASEPGYQEPPPRYVPGVVLSAWRRLYRPSTHPDRSAALAVEPRGRLDKLDLWVVAALVVVLLSMRVYDLGQPSQMYFDEVYHARTATEFLQDWRYGTPHHILEWTHPHFAKYAIAAGITLFSDDKVTATGTIDATVEAVLVEPRAPESPADMVADPTGANSDLSLRFGDRALVATGTGVLVYDLRTREPVHAYAIPGADALSQVAGTGLVYVGTPGGRIYSIDTNSLDDVQNGLSRSVAPPVELGVETGLAITHLYSGSPPYLLASDAAGNVVSIDLSRDGGTIVGSALVLGLADFASMGAGPPVLLETGPAAPAGELGALAGALGLTESRVRSAYASAGVAGRSQFLDVGTLDDGQAAAVQDLIDAGSLPDIALQANPQILIAYRSGVALMDARNLELFSKVATDSPATSIAVNYTSATHSEPRDWKDQSTYVAAGSSLVLIGVNTEAGPWTIASNGTPLDMPGPITTVVIDDATRIAQALGRAPNGDGATLYSIETNGNTVFSDARLPFEPVSIGLDSSPLLSNADHEEVLALSPDGAIAGVDVGQFAFSWRIVGVLFGVLMAVCLYLLVRLLFRRHSVGLLVALFSMTDGMLFVQSRIAMNDTYVGGFLLLAYLIFAVLWLNGFKSPTHSWVAFWVGMPILGLVLGLALGSKWVGLYAMASIGILILIRSALGRLLTIVGMALGTGVLGWMAIAEMTNEQGTGNPGAVVTLIGLGVAVVVGGLFVARSMPTTPDRFLAGIVAVVVAAALFCAALLAAPGTVQGGGPNYTFFLIMLAATAAAAAANAYHPIAWSRQELQFAIAAPAVVGALALVDGLVRRNPTALELGVGALCVAAIAAAGFRYCGRLGFGPLAPPPDPDDPASFEDPPSPAPDGWLRLGSGFGLPAIWTVLCVLVLPIAIYVGLYVPWSMPWQPETPAAVREYAGALPVIFCPDADQYGNCVNGDGWPAGHTGETLIQQTIDMYDYHNDLRDQHPASSPWWAWPLDLKPVWLENAGYADGLATMIYDGGNPVLWWLAISAMGFITWQAFKRRSLGLALLAIAFFWQWLSWSRIDRAAFEYHFYTAVPFFLAALAYFLAELWHGPSRRTWLLARVAAAAALLLPAVLWLVKDPLCQLAQVSSTGNAYSPTICGGATGDVRIEARMLLIAVVLAAALVALALAALRVERRQRDGAEDRLWMAELMAPVVPAGVLLWWLGQNAPHDIVFEAQIPSDGITLLLLPVLAALAFVVLKARNPRRFVLGACVCAVLGFAVFYPNFAALPLPGAIIDVYEGLLPTWFYGFQFAVNMQEGAQVSPTDINGILLGLVVLFVAGMVAWAAWEHRLVVGLRRARRSTDRDSDMGSSRTQTPH